MRFRPAGGSALLVELGGLDEVLALHEALRRDPLVGVAELVPAASTILIVFDPVLTGPTQVAAHVNAAISDAPDLLAPRAADQPEVTIPVVYDGPDLAEVASLTGLPEDEVVERHSAGRYTVAFCGFAPGFAYLAGLDPLLTVPRRRAPRTEVPSGSVAVADRFTAVYPNSSPGGWQLLGRTAVVLWDTGRQPPALLPPGTRVRFVRAGA